MQKEKIEFIKERDFGEIINVTLLFIKQNYNILLKSVLYYLVPFAIIVGALLGLNQHSSMAQLFNQSAVSYSNQIIAIIIIVILAVIIFSLMPAIILEIFRDYQTYGPENMDMARIWEKARKSLGLILGLTVSIVGIMIGFIFLMVLFAKVTPWLIVFFFLPLFYASIVVYFAFPVRVLEGGTIGESLKRAFFLVNGNWWWTFLIYFVISLIVSIIGMAFAIPQYVYLIFIGITSAKGGTPELSMGVMIFTYALTFVGQIIVNNIPIIALTFQYYNLLEKKDKPGLQRRIDEILPESEILTE